MSSVGIIAEYNPFHNGHAYHILRAKELSAAENAIICMSASFTQRGEPACLDKYARTRLALLGGADMVIELPDILSCACAERFGYGGVRILSATGLIDSLAFGSECGDIEMLTKAATFEIDSEGMRAALASGLSYPSAAAQVMMAHGIALDASSPNDMLAVEYIRQLNKLAPDIRPIAIHRVGAGYNETSLEKGSGFASASALRKAAESVDLDVFKARVPEAVFEAINKEAERGRFPASLTALSPAVLYALRSMGTDRIATLADVSEGLENPIYRAALNSCSVTELLCKVKTKRYTLARLRRILSYSLIGSTAELQRTAFEEKDALYIRVLGVRKTKLGLLSELAEKASLPVIVSAADRARLPDNAGRVFEHARRAQLVHALAFPENKACRDDLSFALITV